MKKRIYFILTLLILLPFVSSFGVLVPDATLSEQQVEEYINNSNFNFGMYNLTLGSGFFEGTLIPLTSLTHDIGSGANRWRWLYVQNISVEHIDTYSLTATGNITAGDFILGDGSFLSNVNVTDIWVNESGDTMTGNLNMGSNNITNIWHTYSEDFYVGNYIQEQGDSGTFIQFPGDRHVHIWSGGYPVAEFIGGTPKGYLLLGDGMEEVDFIVYGSTNQKLLHVDSVLDRIDIIGFLNVTGDVNVSGNLIAENVFLHSHIFTHTDVSLTVPNVGSWVNITFDKNAPSVKSRITHTWTDSTNDTFTIIDSGEYKIHMSLVAIDSSATPDSQVEYRILKNNVEVAGSGRAIDIDRQDYDRSKDSFAIVDLSSGDELNFQFTSDSTTAGIIANCLYLDTCSSAVISIERTA